MNTSMHENSALTPALALAPILFLVVLLACSVYLFGADSSYGANQIALILAGGVAALVGQGIGISWKEAQQGIILSTGQQGPEIVGNTHQRRQKAGVKRIARVKISSRPSSMAKLSAHLAGSLSPT